MSLQKRVAIMSSKRILVGGYIDLNAVDGSAFFIAGLTSMLARFPNLEFVLAPAVEVVDWTVLSEVLPYPNVEILDPKSDYVVRTPSGSRLSRQDYALSVAEIIRERSVDQAIVRDSDTGKLLAENLGDQASKLFVYVTGISALNGGISKHLQECLQSLIDSPSGLLFQTPHMVEVLSQNGVQVCDEKYHILPPHVPPIGELEKSTHTRSTGCNLIYSGKFFPDWNVDKILAGFKSVSQDLPRNALSLDVVGKHFRDDTSKPNYVANTKYLLSNTDQVTWYGGMSRAKTRHLISKSDIGISWRRNHLDSSTELSTKVLEYGSLGKPVVLNRTASHEALLGKDYPFFCNSMAEYKRILSRLPDLAEEILEAGDRCFEVAQEYTYDRVAEGLLLFMNRFENGNAGDGALFVADGSLSAQLAVIGKPENSQLQIDGAVARLSVRGELGRTSYSALELDREALGWKQLTSRLEHSLLEVTSAGQPMVLGHSETSLSQIRTENELLKRQLAAEKAKLDKVRGVLKRLDSAPGGSVAVKLIKRLQKQVLK
ncbi:glycosyltransferase [Corynebacterium incognita]|uniref:Glycosyltransferase n=1 Tax=Corynebacterium incognita TaxID=2754725 RepID=A0A7G7CQT8_9CORY|nr:glycosyltransferase [Corynebacterium incognita]QNE89954.1 glycosyltransferase [Corynebacterium incognita]